MGNKKMLWLTSIPGDNPVTLDEIKAQLRIVGTAEDSYLTIVQNAASQAVEAFLDRALITQSWAYVLDKAPRTIRVPLPPLISVESIKVYDWDNNETTVDTDTYLVLTTNTDGADPGLIILKEGNTWPSHRNNASFRINFTAGFGASPAFMPHIIKQGILMLCTKIYERRGDDIPTTQGIKFLLMESDLMGLLYPLKAIGA